MAKTVEELAWEVIRGNWGNGQTRKTRLTNAGYNYDTVQAKVNELLRTGKKHSSAGKSSSVAGVNSYSGQTRKPTGLSIKRDGDTFTFSWKVNDDDYDKNLIVQYAVKTVANYNKKLEYTTIVNSEFYRETSKSVNVHPSAYKNTLILGVYFRVAGTRSDVAEGSGSKKTYYVYDQSVWAEATYILKTPRSPEIKAQVEAGDQAKFTWSTEANDTDEYWYTGYELESTLIKNGSFNGTVKYEPGKNSYISQKGSAKKDEIVITENTSTPGWKTDATFKRHVRVRSVGPIGKSLWSSTYVTYAMPKAPRVNDRYCKATIENTNTMHLQLKWDDKGSFRSGYPIDTTMPQYCISTPLENLVAPSTGWTDSPAGHVKGSYVNSTAFKISNTVGIDQCLWVRISVKHDNDTNYSAPVVLFKGKLSKPSGLNVTVSEKTHKATIKANNNSSVPDSFLVVKYYDDTNYKGGVDIAIIPHGSSQVTNVQCPNWGKSHPRFSVYAAQGKYDTSYSAVTGITTFIVKSNMVSETLSEGGEVPTPPSSVVVNATNIPGTINVSWEWTWNKATLAELSWADHEDAWESTSEPSTYVINSIDASTWNISDLDESKTWYVRVRLGQETDGNITYGPYSIIQEITPYTEATTPYLQLSKSLISVNDTVTASWIFNAQTSADVAVVTTSETGEMVYTNIAHTDTIASVILDAQQLGWTSGNVYSLAVRVATEGGSLSEWSEPVHLTVADPISVVFESDSLVHDKVIVADKEAGITRTITALTEMPFRVHVTGSGNSGTTQISIERTEDYRMERPDESLFSGSIGEVVANIKHDGEEEFVITNDDIIGYLDDGASYRIAATITDGLGQTATDYLNFEVSWDHQAVKPSGLVEIDNYEAAAIITPLVTIPDGYELADDDVCDIYRLSADKPELVYKGASFNTKYVDPYPTIGDKGGYRFVFRTGNNDYITQNNELAWYDAHSEMNALEHIIDFGNDRVLLTYNVDLSSSWTKDFKETKYLGGSVQGDWNPSVSRNSSISGVVITATDQEEIEAFRRLAVYPGICRVRTKDGSNYSANVEVSESRGHEPTDLTTSFSLSVTRVDQEAPAGVTYDDWQNAHK